MLVLIKFIKKFIKKRLQHKWFPKNITKFLRMPTFIEQLR